MPNIAVLGPLEVLGAPVKALLYVDFKNGRAKIHVLIVISKKGRVQAQKCNFIGKFHTFKYIRTHSSGNYATLWIFGLHWCQKYLYLETLGQKIIISGKCLIKILEIIPLSLFCGKVRQTHD